MGSFYDFQVERIDGTTASMSEYRDEALLIVNLASQWGLTPQYAGLRTLHENIDGLTVLGFPCNQFGAQEPGSNAEILEFATKRYQATFPMFAKIDVNGPNASPLYDWLKTAKPGDIGWNFTKFLVSKQGEVIERFEPKTTPEEIADALPALLK
jgi:glutathione peroxidase